MDPAEGPVQRFAFELRKLRQEAGGLSYRVMAERAQYSITALSQAAAGEKLPSLPLVLAYVTACGGDTAAWERRWHEAVHEDVERRAPGPDEDGPAPYQGLARFEPADHERFFGRKRLVDEVSDVLRGHRCAALVGPSGSGKSSLLRAGVIPRLQRAQDPVLRAAALRVLTPGEHPLRTHREVLAPAPGNGDTWLVVDQFEEVFTLCRDAGERAEFIDRLLTADDPESRLRVVLGIRADFYGSCLEHPGLVPVLRRASVPIGPMTPEELRDVVIKPAAARGLIVERALTTRLVEEVAEEPGGLPLLSHALLETWRRRRGRTLTTGAYEAAGGLHGAIAQTAEDLYAELSPDQRGVARRILLRLITPGQGAPDTRCPVDRSVLGSPGTDAGETGAVLERLARARLITLDEETADLAHEALITAWPRLRGWLDEDRERLLLHHRLRQDARSWEELDRDSGSLYRGVRLAEAEEAFGSGAAADELTAAEAAFLAAGRTARTRERRRRRGLAASLAVLVVLSLLAGVVAWQQNRAGERRHAEATSRRIASLAQNMSATDPVTALKLGVAAWRVSPTTEARAALLGAATQREQESFSVPESGDDEARLISGDGRTLVSISDPGPSRVWDVVTHERIGSFSLEGAEFTDLSPDGRRMLVGTDGQLELRQVTNGRPIGPPIHMKGDTGHFTNGATGSFTPSGRLLTLHDTSVRLWDIQRRRTVFQRPDAGQRQSAVSTDDRLLALCPEAGALEIWDIRAHRRLPALPAAAQRAACRAEESLKDELLFDPTGRHLVVADDTGARRWDLASRRELPAIHWSGLQAFSFSPDGGFLVAAVAQEILLWRLSDPGRPVFRYRMSAPNVGAVHADPRSGTIRYLAGFDTGAVYTLWAGRAFAHDWRQQGSAAAVFSPDGSTVALMRRSGRTARFTLRSTHDVAAAVDVDLPPYNCRFARDSEDPPRECVPLMAFSPDSRRFAYGAAVQENYAVAVGPSSITLWDLRRRTRMTSFHLTTEDDAAPVDSIAFTADSRSLLAYRESSEALDTWDPLNGKRLRQQGASEDPYASHSRTSFVHGGMAVRPDGRFLATTHSTHFPLPDGRPALRSLTLEVPTAITYSRDGEHLAVGEATGRVTVWNRDATRRLAVLPSDSAGPDAASVTALAYSPDGTTLATADASGTVRLWEAASSRPLGGPLPTPGDPIRALAFNADGTTLLMAGRNVPLQTYPVDPERVTAEVCHRAQGGLSRTEWATYIPELEYRSQC
ncbi:nSTAND1 domain-containing NTPase [Streptomyces sp. NPDC002446]